MIEIGNCVDLMKQYPDEYFDMVFTSPPFKDEDIDGDYWAFYDSFFKEAYRVAGKVLIIIQSATKLNTLIQKYPPKRVMIWGKGIIAPAWRYNLILVYQKSEEYKVNKYIWSDCFGVPPIKNSSKCHKYQDPLILYETIIGMFKGCSTVLDPFCGSGTTLQACNNLSNKGDIKKGHGMEINPEYLQMIISKSKHLTLDTF